MQTGAAAQTPAPVAATPVVAAASDDSWGSSAPSSAPASDGFGSSSGGFSSGGFGGGFSGGSADKSPTNVLFVGGLSFNTDENGLQAGNWDLVSGSFVSFTNSLFSRQLSRNLVPLTRHVLPKTGILASTRDSDMLSSSMSRVQRRRWLA